MTKISENLGKGAKLIAAENRFKTKQANKGIIIDQIIYDRIEPRGIDCTIIREEEHGIWFFTGVAIRTITDVDDEPFGCSLAFKRARKDYNKWLREQELK